MNENTLEFMKLNKTERAEVITDMVTELAKETELPLPIVIAMIAEYKNCSVYQIEQYMKIHDADLFYQVAYYDCGQKVYKHQMDSKVRNILEEYLYQPILEHPFNVSASWIKKTIEDFFMVMDWDNFCKKPTS